MSGRPHLLYSQIDPRSEEEKQGEFLVCFMEERSIIAAAAKSKVSVYSVQQWRLRDTNFILAFNEVAETILLQAEEELYNRAVVGELTPVFQGGKEVGKVRKKSDILLMFFLKANMPEKYNRTDDPKDKGGQKKDAAVVILPSNGREIVDQPPAELPIEPKKGDLQISDDL